MQALEVGVFGPSFRGRGLVFGALAAASTPSTSAAVQLNHFLLRKKLGFGQCSQKDPEVDGVLKRGLNASAPNTKPRPRKL